MPYLAIKKVKGRYYGYMQESYREGGSVRTRTVEYLGAIEPAVAQQVQATRQQLGTADMAALVKSVRKASSTATRAPEKPPEAETTPAAPERITETPQPRYKRLTVNGRPQLVDMNTGELLDPKNAPLFERATVNGREEIVHVPTGEIVRAPDEVITTEAKPTLRPFAEALKLPAKIETHKLSRASLHGTHRKFGERLKRLEINPATMPDVVIKYGHPDGLKQGRDGSYTITTSRKPKRGHTLNKAALWRNYRNALSRATLDSIEAERPDLFAAMQSQLSHSHQEGKRLLLAHISQTTSGVERLGLSLQLLLWDKLPAPTKPQRKTRKRTASSYKTQAQLDRQSSTARDLGQMSLGSVNNWREESALILAEAHKNGWNDLADKTARTVGKHKAAISKKRREIEGLSRLDKLAGKRRKLLREIIATEIKLRAAEQLALRQQILRGLLDR